VKRNLMLLLVSALLVYTLTGCGCSSRDAGTTQTQPTTPPETQTETTQPEDNSLPNGTDGNNTGDGSTIGSGSASNGGSSSGSNDNSIMEDVGDAMTGNDTAANDGVAIDDMLRNGRVRDN